LFKIASFLKKSAGLGLMNFLRSFRIMNWLAGLVWVMHLLACGWYLCAAMHADHRTTWVARRVIPTRGSEPERTLMDEPAEVQWVHAMYFILTVFSTVGFGDMSAYTTGEIVYVCIVMIVGAVAHGIVIGEVINLISEENEDTRWRKSQSNLLKAFSNHANFPQQMTDKLTDWIDNLEHGRPADYDREEMRQLLVSGLLPRRLLGEMQENLFRGMLVQNRFLKICSSGLRMPNAVMPPRFALMLGTVASCMFFKKDELVFQMYDHAFNLCLVMSGTFACVAEPGPDGGTDVMCDIGNVDSRSQVTVTKRPNADGKSMSGRSNNNAHRKRLVLMDAVGGENQGDQEPTEFTLENPDERDRICSTKSSHSLSSALDTPHSAWTPTVNDRSPWIRVDLGRLKPVCGIIVQGHPIRRKEYVTKVQVEISKDGDTWEMISYSFVMDSVEDGQKENRLTFPPHRARYIRVAPLHWNEAPSMRVGILVSTPMLYPYKLFGKLNFFGDEALLNGQRTCTMRCMKDGEVLVLHKQDLLENGGGVEIFKEFPQFGGVLAHSLYRRQQQRLIMLSRLTRRQTVYNFAASCIQRYWKELYKAKKRAKRRVATSLGHSSNDSRRRTEDSTGSIVPPPPEAKHQGNFAKPECHTESLGEDEMLEEQDGISRERSQITEVNVSPVHGHVAFQDQPSSEGQPGSRGGSNVILKYQRCALASPLGSGNFCLGNVEAKAKDEQARLERQMQVLARDVSSLRSELTGKIDRLTTLLERQSMSPR
jgi:CRP-like cAMP-binding protein